MEDRSSRRMRTLVTQMARRGLSVNEVARALISMMARSTTRSNQRPDTLMQDRICQVDETSCNARPDHTSGSSASSWGVILDFCTAPNLRVCDLLRSRNQEWVLRDGGATASGAPLSHAFRTRMPPKDRNWWAA